MAIVSDRVELMTLSQALGLARSLLAPVVERERVPLAAAGNRVLAEALTANCDLPRHDSAAVDGFAVRRRDLPTTDATALRIIGRAAAGHPFHGTLADREAVRIFTGAPMPAGADIVVMQEDCEVDGDALRVMTDGQRTHCRQQGEDIRTGATVLAAGRRLGAPDIALAAAIGYGHLTVFKRLRVALFSTGDEIKEPAFPLHVGETWDANRWLLRGLLDGLGAEVKDCGIIADNAHAIEGALCGAARESDLLITSGGMSVGSEDHLRPVIERRGTLDIWRLAIKPGKPVGVGDIDACPILALPGNPVAALVTFIALGRTIVARLAGAIDEMPPSFRLPASFAHRKSRGRREYLFGAVTNNGSVSSVTIHGKQGPAMLSTLIDAQGFAVIDEAVEQVEPGNFVEFVPLRPLLG